MYEINWSEEAKRDYNDILQYLTERWQRRVWIKFIEDVDTVLDLIEKFPRAYPKFEDDEHLRKAVINPHVSLFYEVKEDNIKLLFFWNNRRNPDNLPL